jgi:aryl-alcohol dehydrogenase-like predicted oxidoreductase
MLALEKEISIAQLASAYILSKDAVGAIILGAHNTNYLDSNLAILDIDLNASDIDKIDTALSSLKDIEGDIYEEELHYERTYGRLKD